MPNKAKKKPAANDSKPKAAAKKATEPKAAKPKAKAAKAAKPAAPAKAKTKAKAKGTRYTPEQKAKVLDYVNEVNADKGRGGAAAASRKFNISQITIGQWVKKAGTPAKAKKSTKKTARKAAAKPAGKGFAAKLRRLADVHEAITKAEAELDTLNKEYATLKKSL